MKFDLSYFLTRPRFVNDVVNEQFSASISDNLMKKLSKLAPKHFSTNPPSEQEAAAQEQRRVTQNRMQQSMKGIMDHILSAKGDDERSAASVDDALGLHMNLLNLSDSPDEYSKTYDIIAAGNPKRTAGLIMDKIQAMQTQAEQYRNQPVQNMTDRDLSENFADLFKFHTLIQVLRSASLSRNVEFTKEQQEQVDAFQEEFATPVQIAYDRAENIADPHYIRFSPETIFEYVPRSALKGDNALGTDFQQYAQKTVDSLTKLKENSLEQIKKRYLDGASLDTVHWSNIDGFDDNIRIEQRLWKNEPLVATLPNGRVHVFKINAYGDNPGLQSDPELLKTAIGEQMDSSLQGLMDDLNRADRRVFGGSDEFRKVKESLQNLQTAWTNQKENPSAENWQALNEKLAELNMSGADYLSYKIPDGDESHLSSTAQRRVNAVKAIRQFVQLKEKQMALYEGAVETKRQETIENEKRMQEAQRKIEEERKRLEAERKAAEEKKRAEEERKRAEAERKQEEARKKTEEQMKSHKEHYMEQFRAGLEGIKKLGSVSNQEQQRNAYKNLNIPNCTQKDGLGKLRNFIVNTPPLFDAQGYPAHTTDEPVMQSVGAIIGFNMILTERLANKETPVSDKATHPIEFLLNTVGPAHFASTIMENPAVQEKVHMLPLTQKKGYEFFFKSGSVGRICEESFGRNLPAKAEAYARAQVEAAQKKQNAPEKQQAPVAPKKENTNLLP